MAAPIKKSFATPDERMDLPGISADIVGLGDSTISRLAFEPGMHCPQISFEGKRRCMAHHTGYCIAGGLHVQMSDGSVLDIGPDEVFDVPPDHDGVAVGPDSFRAINWAGARTWMGEGSGDRVLMTLLITDVVASTARAVEVGDRAWREQIAAHFRTVRNVLDRYRGREIKTAGDGVIAGFDAAGRAIDAALAIREGSRLSGLAVRAGVHSGEVELIGDDIAGVTVHEAARVAAAAAPDEILVSEATRMLATGRYNFDGRGPFELKGLPGSRTLYSVEASQE